MPLSSASPFFFQWYRAPRALHSFPTRRSSDLLRARDLPVARSAAPNEPSRVPVESYSLNPVFWVIRSEEHTSELQSPYEIVCRLLLEKKKCTSSVSPRLRAPRSKTLCHTVK